MQSWQLGSKLTPLEKKALPKISALTTCTSKFTSKAIKEMKLSPMPEEIQFPLFSADTSHLTSTRGSKESYKALDPEKEEIRILVLPRAGSGPVIYEFIHISLLMKVKYEALSYAWGHMPANKTVEIGQTEFYVRENLFAALEALRLRSRKRYLWVDALCINQLDFDERNSQVAMMSQIYAKADEVVVWLGKAGRDYWGAMVLLDNLGTSETSGKELTGLISDHANLAHAKFWTELSLLCHRPYWQRLWIIQEVVLASKIKAHCSSLVFDWERLDCVFQRLEAIYDTAKSRYIGTSSAGGGNKGHLSLLQTLEALRSSVPARLSKRRQELKQRIPLLDLFLTHQEALCTDQRDRFFGLYSFTLGCCTKATPADYRKSFSETISSVTAHHFRHHVDKTDVLHKHEHFRQTILRTVPPLLQLQITRGLFDDGVDVSEDREMIKAVGSVRGAIVYCSPPLESIRLDAYTKALVYSDLNLTPQLEDQLRYFWHKRGTKGYFHDSDLHPVGSVCNYGSRYKCSITAFHVTDQSGSEDPDALLDQGSNASQKSIPPGKKLRITTQLMSSFTQTLHEAKWKTVQSEKHNNCRLFM